MPLRVAVPSEPGRRVSAASYDGNGTFEGALAYDHLGPDARQRSCPLMGMADQSYYAGDGLNKTLLTPALGLGLSAARSQPGPQRCTLRTRFEAGPANPVSVRPPGSTFLSAETAV